MLPQARLQNHISLTSVHRLEQMKKQQMGKKTESLIKDVKQTNKKTIQKPNTPNPTQNPADIFGVRKNCKKSNSTLLLVWVFFYYFNFLRLDMSGSSGSLEKFLLSGTW